MNDAIEKRNNGSYLLGFSIAGSLLIIALLAFINYSTSPRFPWFLFPTYAVLWWPILTIFIGRHSAKALSLVGSFVTIAFLFLINYLTSWNYPWFLFPSFAILWWPIALCFGSKNHKLFSIIGSFVIIAFFIVTNIVTSPSVSWFRYPLFAVIWWPLSVLFAKPKTIKFFSIVGSIIIVLCLTFENMATSNNCPWVLFTYFPVLMWPVGVTFGRRLGKLNNALFGSFTGIIYYLLLNIFVFKGFPWAIFPIYALLWWPLAVAFAKHGKELIFSVAGTLLSTILFIAVNWITSPNTIWAIYPIFVFAWWPLSIYYYIYRLREI